MTDMTKADRDALIRVAKNRAKQAEREAETREKILIAEIQEELTAEFDAEDQLWAEAVRVAEQQIAKANAQIEAACLDMGVPSNHAPRIQAHWMSRSPEYSDRTRRAQLKELATKRVAALTKLAKTAIQDTVLRIEEQLLLGGLSTDEARSVYEAMPTAEQLMPNLDLADLGVVRWQPDEDAAHRLMAPRTTADRKRRQVLRAIANNPGASNRQIAQIAGVDHKTVAAYRGKDKELPTRGGEFPDDDADDLDDQG
jgi:Winged helix-turn-helix DNA-binding